MARKIKEIKAIHSKMDIAEKYVWFLNEPNYEFIVTDEKVIAKIENLYASEKPFTKPFSVKERELTDDDVILDPILSDYSNFAATKP